MNCEGTYILPNDFFTTFDYFSMLRLRHWELSQEAVAVTEGSLIITDVQNKRSKKQLLRIYPPVKVANKKMSIKKFSIVNLQYY